MTNQEAIKYLIRPSIPKYYQVATNTRSYDEYLKQKEAYELAVKALKDIPHGEWIPQSDVDGFTYWKCSECNKESDFIPFNYCPNCGADMREEKEEKE